MLIVGSSVPAAARTARTIARSGDSPAWTSARTLFQPGERFQGQLGAVEPFFPQASARPEALQSGRDAEGDGIKWLGHLSLIRVVATPKMIIPDSLSDKRRISHA